MGTPVTDDSSTRTKSTLASLNVEFQYSTRHHIVFTFQLSFQERKDSTHNKPPHLIIVITFKWKISRGMQHRTARCQQPTHRIGQKIFHWAQQENMEIWSVNV